MLTSLNGFSAHVNSTITSSEGAPQTASGELLGREGKFIFQPSPVVKSKRADTAGGMFFIWDEGKHSGYVLSEALQAYAPITPDFEAAGQFTITNEGIQQVVNNLPCHRCKATVILDRGIKAQLTLWRTDDARNFPVRIEAANGSDRMVLDFSEIRLETPSRELFLPPDGFTVLESSTALMNELIVREASVAKKPAESAEIHSGNWHDTPGVAPLGR